MTLNASLRNLSGVVLDVETGGTDPERDALLRLAYVTVKRGEIVESRSWRVYPAEGLRISDEAVAVNRWPGRNAVLDSPERTVLLDLHRAIGALAESDPSDGLVLVGHGVDFDRRFVSAAAKRTGISSPTDRLSHRILDSGAIGRLCVLAGEVESGSLDELCLRYLGARRRDAHVDPLADCLDSLSLLARFAERWEWSCGSDGT